VTVAEPAAAPVEAPLAARADAPAAPAAPSAAATAPGAAAPAAACPRHAGETLLGPCERCGDFVCPLESRAVEGRRLCLRCAPIVEGDYLERYRREMLGRPDGFWVLFGVICPVLTAVFMWSAPPLEAAFGVGGLAIFAGYFLKHPWARVALFLCPAAGIGLAVPHGPDALGGALAAGAVGGATVLGAYLSPQNRLTFGLDVERPQLERLWNIYRNNPRARDALYAAVFGWLVWVFLPIGLLLGIYALTQVNERGDPPIGRRREAVAAIVVASLGIAVWGAAVVLWYLLD
jgi:hypothetical protein